MEEKGNCKERDEWGHWRRKRQLELSSVLPKCLLLSDSTPFKYRGLFQNGHEKTTTVKPRNCKQTIWDGAELRRKERRATDNITCNFFPSKTSSRIMLRKNIQVQRKTTQALQNIENVLVQKYILAGILKRMQETLNKTVGCDYLA